MLNLRKKTSNTHHLIIVLIIAGLVLGGCNLNAASNPSPVEPAPTLPPTDIPTEIAQPAEDTQPTDAAPPPAETSQPANTPIPQAESLPDPTGFQWQVFQSNLNQPLYLTHAGDESGRVFIVEKAGRIIIVENGERLAEPFLDISGRINSQDSERGLLGLAFHPDYTQNGYFYVNYTDLNGNTVVSRFEVTAAPNLAAPNSESILLRIDQPYGNHNGGMLAFGPDGYLYIGTGDGGSGGDPQGNAQNPNTLLGKILRLDVDSEAPYAIPPGNNANGLPEIWALGLRNPWRFSFDKATGDLFIGDVGQNQWEEIHLLPAGIAGGANLGWDYYEANHAFEGTPPGDVNFIFPIMEYSHSGGNCSVTGGYVYRGQAFDGWQGVYLFGDYCSGTVWAALPDATGMWQAQQAFQVGGRIASFGEDQNGELYLVDLGGTVYKLAEN